MIDPTQYLVLHRSLAKYAGAAAAQAAHAASEAMSGREIPQGTTVVVLEAQTSGALEDLSNELSIAGLHSVLIREPDIPYSGAACALGCEVAPRDSVKGLFANFKVFR